MNKAKLKLMIEAKRTTDQRFLVDDAPLAACVKHALYKAGVKYADELQGWSEEELLKLYCVGGCSVRKIRYYLDILGLKLKGE